MPPREAGASVDYIVPASSLRGLGAGVGLRYLDHTWADSFNPQCNPKLTVTDLSLHYDADGYSVVLSERNVFDKQGYLQRRQRHLVAAAGGPGKPDAHWWASLKP